MNSKITDTQIAVLKAAAGRPDGNIDPLPTTLRGGARTQVIKGLLVKGLAAKSGQGHVLTEAGYAAIGKRRPVSKAPQELEAMPRLLRPGTKLAAIIDAMRHPSGATIAQIMAGTGWQAHTVRGAISGMVRKRLGYEVVTEKGADGQRAYRIA